MKRIRTVEQFASGLITTDFAWLPRPPFNGRGWKIVYRIDSHKRCPRLVGGHIYRGREIIIISSGQTSAQKAIGLIHAAMVLLCHNPILTNQFWTIANAQDERRLIRNGQQPNCQYAADNLPIGCLIAKRASYKRNIAYALHKFVLSCQIYSPDLRSLDPGENYHYTLSQFVDDHVRFAFAIIAAYSIIEELGLEVRTTKEHPQSSVNGEWDETVKAELEERLKASKISLAELIPWHLRGSPTQLERLKQPKSQGRSVWARGQIRDCEMNICDAISYASWLRSSVSSHKLARGAKTRSDALSPYDVANVQHLARRLLLENLGFWPSPWLEAEQV